MRTLAVDRAATREEIAVIRWLLDHAPVGEVEAYRNQAQEGLRVVGQCDCGCASLFFESEEGARLEMIADAIAKYGEKMHANLILWGRAPKIAWLEISGPGEAIRRFPKTEDLALWEQLYDPE